MKQVEYGLEGAFKVDLYSGESMASTTDWFSNFITPTGLMYPTGYAFADCFRYLSIGSDQSPSAGSQSLSSFGTKSLISAITQYETSAGTYEKGEYIDWRGYATGLGTSNCGTVLSSTGPRFFRAWYLPTGAGLTMKNDLTIGEIMVSPSSGESEGKYAFSRVHRNLTIPAGVRAIITYQLKINIKNTGLSYLPPKSFNTSNAEKSNAVESDIVDRWENLSGYYRQVNFGLRAVDKLGLTYVPKYGDGMEPSSKNLSKMIWYLSPDNSQFDVSSIGGVPANEDIAYSSNGLMSHVGGKNLSVNYSDVVSIQDFPSKTEEEKKIQYNENNLIALSNKPENTQDLDRLSNIRLGRSSKFIEIPKLSDYKELIDTFTYQTKPDQNTLDTLSISYATPGTKKWSEEESDFGKLAIFASNTVKAPLLTGGLNAITGRKKTLTRKSVFSPISSLGYNTRFGSLVYAYEDEGASSTAGDKQYWPMIDCQFIDSSGNYLLPHYRYISGIHLTNRGTGILNAHISLESSTNDNIQRFKSYKTFQGPYDSTLTHRIVEQSNQLYTDVKISGFLLSGYISPETYGDTGEFVVNGNTYSSGWGAVYGLLVDDNFVEPLLDENTVYNADLALAKHWQSGLFKPEITGTVYWPNIAKGNEVKVKVTGVKYWVPDFIDDIFEDDDLWFNADSQIVKNIYFEKLNASYNLLPPSLIPTRATGYNGWALSTVKYDGSEVTISNIVGNVGNFGFTGYIGPSSNNTVGQLKGTSWNAETPPTNTLKFVPSFNVWTVNYKGNDYIAKQISGLLINWEDRGYANGLGGTKIKADDSLDLFFTGFSGGNSLFLTYISGSGGSVWGHSYLSGKVEVTNFSPPTGYPIHLETYGDKKAKLATNFAPAQYYGSEVYQPTLGGEYPASSLDNGLELYLDISWSSPCGKDTLTCNEPPA